MIKINLLPTKKKPPKKVTDLQQQMILGLLVLALVGVGMGYWWRKLDGRIAELEKQRASAQARLSEQDNLLKEVVNIEGERKKVTEKIGIIEQLKTNQSGPVRLLDELSKALPLGVNLTSFSESGGGVSITGTAFTNDDIVRFVDNLKASLYLKDVFLVESVQGGQGAIEIYSYRIQFTYKGV